MTPLPCLRELITENQEKIFCSGWAKANRKGEDVFLPLDIVPLFSISRNIRTEVKKNCVHANTPVPYSQTTFQLAGACCQLTISVIRSKQRNGAVMVILSIIMVVLIILIPKQPTGKYQEYRKSNKLYFSSLSAALSFHALSVCWKDKSDYNRAAAAEALLTSETMVMLWRSTDSEKSLVKAEEEHPQCPQCSFTASSTLSLLH